eukprot:TRINITY_DN31145_c0_g1_i1.p1 TRINITY_DN31145_c0_g1~~TRINITY_DN31145_c0_g1_i1.p1  ORF type:complete len:407 (+),score=51.06 TRINITY_DN31145_c0_g1_i1:2-1222(+)
MLQPAHYRAATLSPEVAYGYYPGNSPIRAGPVVLDNTGMGTKAIMVEQGGRVEEFCVGIHDGVDACKAAISSVFAIGKEFTLKDPAQRHVIPSYFTLQDKTKYQLVVQNSLPVVPPSFQEPTSSIITANRRAKAMQEFKLDVNTDFRGSVRAVLIGVEYKRKGGQRLSKGNVVEKGVKKMREFLEGYRDPMVMEVLEVEEEGGIVMKKDGTRKQDILRWAEWLVQHPAQVNIFYFIGHIGVVDNGAGEREEVLLPSDFRTNTDEGVGLFNAITSSELLSIFSKTTAKITCIFDTTYTGSVLPLPCKLRLCPTGTAEMIDSTTDQDSPLLGTGPDLTVLSCVMSRSTSGTVEGVFTSSLTHALLKQHTNESLLQSVSDHLKRYHPAAYITPTIISNRVVGFDDRFNL